MSQAHHDPAAGHHDHTRHYVKIWAILLACLFVSVVGTFTGVFIITMICAFGVATLKAYLVIKHFMHLDVERPIVWYALGAGLAIMVLFFAAVSPDVLNHSGSRWVNVAAEQETERREAEHAAGGGGHGAEHAPAAHEAPAGAHP